MIRHGRSQSARSYAQVRSAPILCSRPSTKTAFSVEPVPSVHLPPSWIARPGPLPAAQFHRTAYRHLPRPWSSAAYDPSPTGYAVPSTVIVPCTGRPMSLTVYWNRRVLHGTTTPRDSWPGGSGTVRSTSTPGALARTVLPSGPCSTATVSFPHRARTAPVPLTGGSTVPRANGTTASAVVSRPVRRSSR